MIGGQNHNSVLIPAAGLERAQHLGNRLIDIANTVEVIALQALPELLVMRVDMPVNLIADMHIGLLRPGLGAQIFCIETGRQRYIPALGVYAGRRPRRNRPEVIFAQPAALLGCARAVEHDVVRVDEIDCHEPGLFVILVLMQPGNRIAGRDLVENEPAHVRPVRIAVEVVIGKTERQQRIGGGFHHAIGQIRRLGNVRQMPLALVGGLIPEITEHMAQGRYG